MSCDPSYVQHIVKPALASPGIEAQKLEGPRRARARRARRRRTFCVPLCFSASFRTCPPARAAGPHDIETQLPATYLTIHDFQCPVKMAAEGGASAGIRRRRRAKTKKDGSAAAANTLERKKSTLRYKRFPIVPVGGFFLLGVAFFYYYYQKYGISTFIDRSVFDLKHSPGEWRDIMSNKTVLLIGGPHRGGTTILWKAIKAHPEISGFGTTRETGVDESEGILLQDVYSRFGVGMEDIMKKSSQFRNKMIGVGRFALADESEVHLTETDPKVTGENMAKLLNRFGQYWNLTQPVLIEKSPQTITMSRFLQALYHAKDEGGSNSPIKGGPEVKFLFITRHPIANMMAHENMVGKDSHLTYDMLMRNYIQMHKYLVEDLPMLHNDPMIITLEEFAADPSHYLSNIYQWLGVDGSEDTVKNVLEEGLGTNIWPDPNDNYKSKWCGAEGANDIMPAFKRDAIVQKYSHVFQNDLSKLGYDLKTWCDETN